MKYVFDSSSIFILAEKKQFKYFTDGFTLSLAKYEIGNILWKEHHLFHRITAKELEEMISIYEDVFRNMDVFDVGGHLGYISKMASRLGISFYDASYVYFASKEGCFLITADIGLAKRAHQEIKVLRPDDLINGV